MRVWVTARRPRDSDVSSLFPETLEQVPGAARPGAEVEIPDGAPELLSMVRLHGRFSATAPGDQLGHPTLWTLHFENDYD